ncbi:hypothetical protein [Streptomyces altiplanensis]
MARVVLEGSDIVVRLSWFEKPAARRRGVRAPGPPSAAWRCPTPTPRRRGERCAPWYPATA